MLLSCNSWSADSSSAAYGARLDLDANVQVIGLGAGVATLARTPDVNASGSSSYGPLMQSVLNTSVGLLGTTVLSAGVLAGETEYASATPFTTARGYAENVDVNLQITPLLPLLGLGADSIEANAEITGVCGNLVASGSSLLVGAQVSALGGGLLNLPVSPPPNFTVDLSALGIVGVSLVLNEQVSSGDGNQRSITVNALHLDVSANVLLARLSGDIIIGHARAQRSCAAGDGPNLRGAKSATPNPATVGQPLVFNISAQNIGNQTASNVVLTDTLNAAFNIQSVSASGAGSCNTSGQTVTCTFPAIAPGATGSAVINVIPTTAGSFSNSLNTGFDGPDVDPGDDDPTIEIPVNPATLVADVDVQLSANPNPATVGIESTVRLTVRNSGPDATAVNLSQQLTGGLNVVSVVASDGGICTGTLNLSCSWTSIATGGTRTVDVRVMPLTVGTINANATLAVASGSNDPDPSDNTASLAIPVQAAGTTADLSVVKTASPNPATVGQPLTFTLQVSNAGPDAAGASVADALPASVTLQSASASNGGSCSGSNTVVCSWPSIPAGASRTATIITVPNQAGTLTNAAAVTSTTGSTDPDTGDDNSTIQVAVNPAPSADFSVVKTANPTPATVGQALTFTLTLNNAGPDAAGASVSDSLPAGVTLQSATASGDGACSGSSTVVCSWNQVPAGQTRSASIVVIPTVSGTLSNTAVIEPTGGATDPDPGDDSSTILVPVDPIVASADLGLSMSASPNPVTVGTDLVYTLTVNNAGPNASAARVTDALPASLVLQSAIASGAGSCSGGTVVVCNWPAIGSGESRTATLTVRPTVVGALGNSANVESTDGSTDPNPANNSASTQVQVDANQAPPAANLAVSQSASPQPATAGQAFTLSLALSNAGPDATGATLSNLIDSNFSVLAVNASDGGSCTSVNALNCSWTSVPAQGEVNVLVSLVPVAAGNFANTVSVATVGGIADPDTSNNSNTQSLQVNPGVSPAPRADFSALVRALPETVSVGQELVLQVEVRNAGPEAAAATLNQSLDPGFTLVELSQGTGVSCSGSTQISCSITTLASGATASMQLRVSANRSGNLSHQASVAVLAPAIDPELSNNSGIAMVTSNASSTPANADLSVRKEAIPMDPVIGAPVDYLITITNQGPDNAAGPIVMVDELPTTLVAQSVSAQGGGSCTINGGLVRCTWTGLASGTSVTASVLARATVTGLVRNVATVTHPNTDADPSDNVVEVSVDVRPLDGIRSDGGQCKVSRQLTDHNAAGFQANAEIRYGGGDVIYADQLGTSDGTFTESLLVNPDKLAMIESAGSDAHLLVASKHGATAIVRSSKNLADNGAALDAPAVFMLDLQGRSARRLPAELSTATLMALDGAGTELYYLVAAGSNTELKRYLVSDSSVQTLQSYPAASALFSALKVSHNGQQVAFTAQINPVGQNNDGSMEVFRFDVDSAATSQVTAGVNSSQSLGGFDGAGERLTWIANGQIHVHDPVNGSRQLTSDAHNKRTALLSHNGRKVAYLAEAGEVAGSFELSVVDVDGTAQAQVLTQLDLAGSDDRLLSHDGSAQTFLLASKRQLIDSPNPSNGNEHLYVIDCDAIRSGAWFNPLRSGQGYAIQRSQDGLAVLWYTYRADGTPTWYIASGPRQGKSWQADLLDVRYNAVDGSRTLTTVGTLALSFDDSHNAMAHWTLNGITRFETIQFIEFDRRPPLRDDTGVWFDPNNPGWGMSLSHQGRTRFMLTYLYDQSGQPVWIEGQTNLDALQTPARLYFGPGLCSTSCGETAPLPVPSTVGRFNVEISRYGELQISTEFQQAGSRPIQWLRATRSFEPLTPLLP